MADAQPSANNNNYVVVSRRFLHSWCSDVVALHHYLDPWTCEQAFCNLAAAGRVQATAVYSIRERLERAMEDYDHEEERPAPGPDD